MELAFQVIYSSLVVTRRSIKIIHLFLCFLVSPQCFGRSRRILFMLDSSRGLGYKELPDVRDFIQDIVEKLYTYPSDIEIGLMHYSDMRTATYSLRIRKRSKEEVTAAIQSFWYRRGSRNYLGDAFKTVRKVRMIKGRSVHRYVLSDVVYVIWRGLFVNAVKRTATLRKFQSNKTLCWACISWGLDATIYQRNK